MRHALGLLYGSSALRCIALHNLRRAGVSRRVGIKYSFKMQHAILWYDALLLQLPPYHHTTLPPDRQSTNPPPTAHVFNCGRCKCKCHRPGDICMPMTGLHWTSKRAIWMVTIPWRRQILISHCDLLVGQSDKMTAWLTDRPDTCPCVWVA